MMSVLEHFDEALCEQRTVRGFGGVSPPASFAYAKLDQKFVIPVRALLGGDLTSKLACEKLNFLK